MCLPSLKSLRILHSSSVGAIFKSFYIFSSSSKETSRVTRASIVSSTVIFKEAIYIAQSLMRLGSKYILFTTVVFSDALRFFSSSSALISASGRKNMFDSKSKSTSALIESGSKVANREVFSLTLGICYQ
jgi:hypothetical protein